MQPIPLFLRPAVFDDLEKTAGEVSLPEDPNQWPKELLQELYKQVPFISDFHPKVEMTKVDGERGYALGHVEVTNRSEMTSTNPEDQQAVDVKTARIPIIIANRKLRPLDLLIPPGEKPSVVPLTESRLRQALFRPETFDVTSRSPGDMSMVGQLYPPVRNGYASGTGFTGKLGSADGEKTAEWKQTSYSMDELLRIGGWSGKGGSWSTREQSTRNKEASSVKTASATALPSFAVRSGSLLQAILPTINDSDYTKCAEALGTPALQLTVRANASCHPAVAKLATFRPGTVKAAAANMLDSIPPSVLQLSKVHGGYTVKSANHRMWHKRAEFLDRAQAMQVFGPKVVLAADTTGSATMADDVLPDEQMDLTPQGTMQTIEHFGLYVCKNIEGGEVTGYVFPMLLDREGKEMPVMLFTNGMQSALQGEIVGREAGPEEGNDVHLMEGGHPEGFGTFYKQGTDGNPIALKPMEIKAPVTMEGATTYMASDPLTGAEFSVEISPGLEKPATVDDKLLVPSDFTWLSLGETDAVALASTPDEASKEAQAALPLYTVDIRGSGSNCFSIDGPAVEKLASDDKHFLNIDDAMFLLSALGCSPAYSGAKLAAASTGFAPIPIRIKHYIKTAAASYADSVKRAAAFLAQLPNLKTNLFKEAAAIPDPNTVDTVLSLGFINPENLSTFVAHLPSIDAAQKSMCELLLASRIGSMPNLSSTSLEKGIRATEDVIEGLKTLAFGQ